MAADASDYPVNADSIPRTNPSQNLTGHSDLHDKMADAIEEIQGFVGVQNDSTSGTLVKRVSDLENKDFTVTFGTGSDLSGSFTVTNLGSVTNTTVAVRDDSHDHVIDNVDGLQDALDGKSGTDHTHTYAASDHSHSYAATSHSHSYAATEHTHSYASTSHNHDSSYYTETEVNNLLATKLNTSGRQTLTASGDATVGGTVRQWSEYAAFRIDAGSGTANIAFQHVWAGVSYAPQFRAAQNYIYLRDTAGNDNCTFNVNKIQSSSPALNSSRTIKHDIAAFDGDATSIVDGLEPVTFRYNNEPDVQHLGFIAEDVATVFPIAVDDTGETPTLNIAHLLALTVAGLQEANARIAVLEARVSELEGN